MRLLWVVHCYPPAIGGVERVVADLCEGLAADHGFGVTVATTDAQSVDGFRDPHLPRVAAPSDEVRNGVRILRFGTRTWLCGAVYRAQFAAWKARLPGNDVLRTWGSGPLSPALRRAARTLPADVVAAASLPLNHLHYPVGRADGAPVVFLPAAHTGDRWGYERPNLVRVLNRGAATVPFTAHECDWLAEQGVRPERLHVIPAGIDTGAAGGRRGAFRAAHGIGTDDTIVAYVGQHGSQRAWTRSSPPCPPSWRSGRTHGWCSPARAPRTRTGWPSRSRRSTRPPAPASSSATTSPRRRRRRCWPTPTCSLRPRTPSPSA